MPAAKFLSPGILLLIIIKKCSSAPRRSLPAMFPEPCCLHLLSPRLRYVEYLLSWLIPMPWASLSLVTTVQRMGTRLCRRERVCNFLSREPEATVVSSLQGGPAIARRHCFLQEAGLARKCQSIATETTVRRKHKGSWAGICWSSQGYLSCCLP